VEGWRAFLSHLNHTRSERVLAEEREEGLGQDDLGMEFKKAAKNSS